MAGSAVGEFARHYKHVDQRAVAPHRHLDAASDRVLDHQLLDRGRGDDVVAVDADHDVAATKGLSFTTLAICSPVAVPNRAASAGATGTCAPAMPNQARRTRPVLISDAMILWVESLTGTASPRPTPATAVLTPTIRPRPSASAPPLFPGLGAASVWITSSTTRPDFVGNDRPSPDTMPAVTLPARPSGLPTATTSWPTRRSSARPIATGAGTAPRALSTARSDSTSRPTTSTLTVVPSVNAASALLTPATTWALVSR